MYRKRGWAMSKGTLTLRRSGEFTLHVRRGSRHCGVIADTGPASMPCEYALTLVCASNCLDRDGFLVEQIGVHRFFQDLPRTSLSCEKLAIKCSRDLYKEIMAENPKCVVFSMSLTISPKPPGAAGSAGMTYDWRPS